MTTRDFMNYLMYIEHAAENLQFYLWHQDYTSRFASAKASETVLAPEWTQEMQDEAVFKHRRDKLGKNRPTGPAADMFKGTDFEKQPQDFVVPKPFSTGRHSSRSDPFLTPPGTADSNQHSLGGMTQGAASTLAPSYKAEASEAFQAAGAKQPCRFPAQISDDMTVR